MTENEAIARMQYRIDTATEVIGKGSDGKAYEDMEIAIKALEEIQQYRAIGTVEECREVRGRQIGKKSVKGRIFKSLGYYQCPTCGGLLMRNEKFCSECGQAILLEGEE